MPDHYAAPRRVPINIAHAAIPELCASCEARHIGLCDALADEDLSFLASVARRQTVPKGKVFIEEGDPARHFFNLNHGIVKLFKSLPDGRRQIIGFMGAGDFLGLAAGPNYSFTAEALGEVHLCRFDRAELHSVFTAFPALERRLLDVASHELVVAQEQMLLLGRKTAIERFASFLVAWHEKMAACATDQPEITVPMTRADMSDYLGLTIETVSRSITALKRRKVIETNAAHKITIIDHAGLEKLAAKHGCRIRS